MLETCSKCKNSYEFNGENFTVQWGKVRKFCRLCKRANDRVYSRKYREDHPEWKKMDNKRNAPLVKRLLKEAYDRDPKPFFAVRAVYRAVRKGLLVKDSCLVCGEKKVDGHHYLGYEKENWLKVKWLCHKHHKQLHAGIITI